MYMYFCRCSINLSVTQTGAALQAPERERAARAALAWSKLKNFLKKKGMGRA